MVHINLKHINAKSLPKEGWGGAMCICPDCTADREKFMVPSELLKRRLESNYEEDNSLDENSKLLLKPCPFCGCEIINGDETDHNENCFLIMMKVEISEKYTIHEIQNAWNKRLII